MILLADEISSIDPLKQNADLFLTFVKIIVSLGVVTAVVSTWRNYRNRRRWRYFKLAVNKWVELATGSDVDHPKIMEQEDWQGLVETLLSDCNFGPFEIKDLLGIAVITAKRIVYSQIVS